MLREPPMTDPQPTPEPPTVDRPLQSLDDVVHHIVWKIEQEILGSGDVASLRRLDVEQPDAAAFWKILVSDIEPNGQRRGDDAETRWALILSCIGELHSLNRRRRSLGAALAAAKVSEMRLARLLRADLETLPQTLRAVCRQIASAGEPVDLAEIAWLVLTARSNSATGPAEATTQRQRRRIARNFYRGLRKAAEDMTSD